MLSSVVVFAEVVFAVDYVVCLIVIAVVFAVVVVVIAAYFHEKVKGIELELIDIVPFGTILRAPKQ